MSGGTDAIILIVDVNPSLLRTNKLEGSSQDDGSLHNDALEGPNPARGAFSIDTPSVPGTDALLSIFDLAGRRVAIVRGRSGARLSWDGRGESGVAAPPGVYRYRIEAGAHRRDGSIVLVRR